MGIVSSSWTKKAILTHAQSLMHKKCTAEIKQQEQWERNSSSYFVGVEDKTSAQLDQMTRTQQTWTLKMLIEWSVFWALSIVINFIWDDVLVTGLLPPSSGKSPIKRASPAPANVHKIHCSINTPSSQTSISYLKYCPVIFLRNDICTITE